MIVLISYEIIAVLEYLIGMVSSIFVSKTFNGSYDPTVTEKNWSQTLKQDKELKKWLDYLWYIYKYFTKIKL